MSGHKITRGHTDGTLTVVTAVNDESTLVDPRPFPFMGTDPDTHMVKDSGSTNRGKENVEVLSLLLRVRTRRSPHFGDFQALDDMAKSLSLNHVYRWRGGGEDDTDRKSFALAYFTSTR